MVGAEADVKVEWEVWRGWRVPGVSVPGVRFYAMHGRRDKTLMIWLKDETYFMRFLIPLPLLIIVSVHGQ